MEPSPKRWDFGYIEDADFVLFEAGTQALRENWLNDARNLFERSIQLAPHYKTYFWLAEIHRRIGDVEVAEGCLLEAYQLNPKSDLVATRLAKSLLGKGQIENARRLVDEVLTRNRTYGPAQRLQNELRQKQS